VRDNPQLASHIASFQRVIIFIYMVCAAIRRIQQRKHELLGYAISLFIALCIGIANFLSRLAWRALDLYNDAADSTQLAVQQASTADRLLRDSTAASASPFQSVTFDASIAGGAAAIALLPGMFQQFTKRAEELETLNAQYLQQQGSLLQQVSEMNTKLEKLGKATIETNAKLEKLSETNAKLGKLSSQLEELRLQQHGLSCPQTTGGWCDGT
jgi:hypothetical protein